MVYKKCYSAHKEVVMNEIPLKWNNENLILEFLNIYNKNNYENTKEEHHSTLPSKRK